MNKPPSRAVITPNLQRRHQVFHVPSTVKLVLKATPPVITPRPAHVTPLPARPAMRQQAMPRRVKQEFLTPQPHPDQAVKIAGLKGCGRGRILIIVGNGPSINELPLQRLRDRPNIDTMSINKPDPRLWPTTYWAFCDPNQYQRHEDLWREYNGIILNSTAITQRRPGTIQIKPLGGKGFSRDLHQGFYIGRSTVYANMQTALWMDYDHVYLVGVDMNPQGVNGQLWFYGVNPDAPVALRKDRFKLEATFYDHAAHTLSAAERKRFTFCSNYNEYQFVDQFGRLDHREAVDTILERHR